MDQNQLMLLGGNSMLMDILGILIGFMGIMLLLSLMVTSLVQVTQNLLRLRAQNLKYGIQVLLAEAKESHDIKSQKQQAEELLSIANPAIPGTNFSFKMLSPSKLIHPSVTWIDPKQLPTILSKLSDKLDDDGKEKEFIESFERLDPFLRKRFASLIRYVTIAWAFIIAAYFQINSFDLLRELHTNTELRAAAVVVTEKTLSASKDQLDKDTTVPDATVVALEQLAEKHPEIAEQRSAITKAGEKTDIRTELIAVLNKAPDKKQQILSDYDQLFYETLKKNNEQNLTTARQIQASLGLFGIKPWPQEMKFYYENSSIKFDNIIGVIFTTILLSLGAPFWFKQLQRVVAFRDALKINGKDEKNGTSGN